MNKYEFYVKLRAALDSEGYDAQFVEKTIEYYKEMIEDRIEDGATEKEAVASLGSIKNIVLNVHVENEVKTKGNKKEKSDFVKNNAKPLRGLVITAQVFFGLILYPVLFSLVITAISLSAAGAGGIFISFFEIFLTGIPTFMFWFGASLVAAGLGVMFIYLTVITFRYGRKFNRFLRNLKWSI